MNDFEKMIREMVASGAKMEDIAKATGDTLNAIQKEEKQKKQNLADARLERLRNLEDTFWTDADDDNLGISHVGMLAAMIMAPKYPDWTVEDIDEFVQAVGDMTHMRAEMVGKGPTEALHRAFSMASQWSRDRNNLAKKDAEDKVEKSCGCGSDRKCTCKDTRSPSEVVGNFLKQFDF